MHKELSGEKRNKNHRKKKLLKPPRTAETVNLVLKSERQKQSRIPKITS